MVTPLFSICITQLNDGPTIRQSLESIFNQIDERFEVVVVDAGSNDISIEILRQYADEGRIKLVHGEGSRGKCRQVAFENSIGKYVFANIDTDDVYNAELQNLAGIYIKHCEGFVLRVRSSQQPKGAVTIASRNVLDKLGGWHDLNFFEEVDLWLRAIKLDQFRWISYPFYNSIHTHKERTKRMGRIRQAYLSSREKIRIGNFPWRMSPGLPLHSVAWMSALFLGRYNSGNLEVESKVVASENMIFLDSTDFNPPSLIPQGEQLPNLQGGDSNTILPPP